MTPTGLPPSGDWRVIGKTVQGASHVRSGTENQDAIAWSSGPGDRLPLILAVADGHGSAKHVRSKHGARLAVKEATTTLVDWLSGLNANTPLPETARVATEKLPTVLENRWKQAVRLHFQENQLSPEACVAAGISVTAGGGTPLQDDAIHSIYGTTLLAVAIMPQFILYLQVGDGDILVVSRQGEVGWALARDEGLIGNQTTSLCQPRARDHFRVRCQPCVEPPALVIAATDGYSNSYQDDEDFLRVGPDILQFLRDEGPDALEAALEGWLEDTSGKGSGDDVTVGIIVNLPSLALRTDPPPDGDGAEAAAAVSHQGRGNLRQALLMAALCIPLAAGAGYLGYLLGKQGLAWPGEQRSGGDAIPPVSEAPAAESAGGSGAASEGASPPPDPPPAEDVAKAGDDGLAASEPPPSGSGSGGGADSAPEASSKGASAPDLDAGTGDVGAR